MADIPMLGLGDEVAGGGGGPSLTSLIGHTAELTQRAKKFRLRRAHKPVEWANLDFDSVMSMVVKLKQKGNTLYKEKLHPLAKEKYLEALHGLEVVRGTNEANEKIISHMKKLLLICLAVCCMEMEEYQGSIEAVTKILPKKIEEEPREQPRVERSFKDIFQKMAFIDIFQKMAFRDIFQKISSPPPRQFYGTVIAAFCSCSLGFSGAYWQLHHA